MALLGFKNAYVVAPMTTYSSQSNGEISPDELPYLERFGRGGFGSVITAACYVHASGHAFAGQWGCDSSDKLDSLSKAADAIHAGGAQALLQIHHGGRQCPPALAGGTCVAPSAIAYPREGSAVPRALLNGEIEEIIDAFGNATALAAKAGFDGVEIHGANTYLLQQFVSPSSNEREDQWNAHEMNFPLSVTRAVLDNAPADFLVGYRFSPEEPEEGGLDIEITLNLIERLSSFPLNFLHISLREVSQPSLHDTSSGPIVNRVLSQLNGRIPLIAAGGIDSSEKVAEARELGIQGLAIGRGAIYDRDWVHRIESGEQPRLSLPSNFESTHLLPKGMCEKIRAVPGWFAVEN